MGKIQLVIVALLSMTGYHGISEKERGANAGQQHKYAAAQLGEEQDAADEIGPSENLETIDKLMKEGLKLSSLQVEDLEARLSQNPTDFDSRIKLLRYYSARSALDETETQVLGLVEHHPDSVIFGGSFWEHAERHILLRPNSPAHHQAAKLWKQATEVNETDAQVLANAASFFLTYPDQASGDRDQTEALLRRAQKLDPKNPRWSTDFVFLYAVDSALAQRLDEEAKQGVLIRAFKYLEESYTTTQETLETLSLSPEERQELSESLRATITSELPKAAMEAQELQKAKKYSLALLESATDRDGWNYGNIIHDTNLILGRVALTEGKIDVAKLHLLEAGKSTGSPQLNSFGPNMSLAKELLERSEREVVLQYFDLCGKFWDDGKLNRWKGDVQAGRIPNFGANLLY